MSPSIGRLLLALICLVAGGFAWTLGSAAESLADEREHAATLQLEAASRVSAESWLGRFWTWLDPEAYRHAARNRYWRRDWDSGTQLEAADDTTAQSTAANATYRRAQTTDARPLSVDQIDQALQAYASVLRNGFDRDAAYNYEFVARQRDVAARTRTGTKPPQRATRPVRPSTIHGREGMDPPTTKGEEFEVLTPMDYGDREAQPEPTTGRKLPPKG